MCLAYDVAEPLWAVSSFLFCLMVQLAFVCGSSGHSKLQFQKALFTCVCSSQD